MRKIFLIIITTILATAAWAQPGKPTKVLDEIVAVIGDNYILKSDLDKEYETIREQYGENGLSDSFKFEILDQLISRKILLYKAQLDSIVVGDDRVEGELERKLDYMLQYFRGDEKALEEYIGTSLAEFKVKTREKLRQQMLMQEMENKVLKDINISPSEVNDYYSKIPKDSLPRISAEIEVAKITRTPKITPEEKAYALEEITKIRQRLANGDDFCLLARLYSMDPSNSGNCGELGFFTRGKMVPEFEAAAFKLKGDTISKVIASSFGFHVLKLIERRGESINVRHILIRPQTVGSDLLIQRLFLDSLLTEIKAGNLTFEEAAKKYSDDEETKSNGGKLTDHNTGSTKVSIEMLDKKVFLDVSALKVGETSEPKLFVAEDGSQAYVVYKLLSETPPHIANLQDDFLKIKAAALQRKKAETLDKWYAKNKKNYYIRISDRYKDHPALQHWSQN